MTTKKFKFVNPQTNLAQNEKQWLKYWKENEVFQKSLTGDKNFSFYDGPPFATGLPHYGHLLAGVLKDVVPRYYTMNGYKVPRRFGWDCHGLPVEAEVQKTLGLYSRKDVLNYGVDKFNEYCRSVVLKYTTEWKETVTRVGRWVDMDQPYHTMDVSFMESVWWVFKELYNKNLVYEGYKVVPFSVGLGSVLSNFEAKQNMLDVQSTAVTVKFKMVNKPWTLLAWTTTPWTLPMNSAVAVNPELEYLVVKHEEEYFVVAKKLANHFFGQDLEVVQTLQGSELSGEEYFAVFNFYNKTYKVVTASYVEDTSGTGLVHLAPAFGEDDFSVGKENNLSMFNPVNDDGEFENLGFLSGVKAFDSVKLVVDYLKKNKLLFKQEQHLHAYPHCYRTNTPLMYRAVSSWFVKVESLKDKLLDNNQTTQWEPAHLRDGRFGNWLENARDWAVSRNRFWGTPLPLWKNDEGEVVCVGSKEELEKLSGVKLTDLHSHFVGHLELPSPTGKSNLKWVGGVLDCWFESGAMPYAQMGYPHSGKNLNQVFPADFVAEGLDQTRGWFYTLMVLGTALFDKAPFKQVVVNGLVLAEDGKKMSKMLKNYPDPNLVLEEFGADALRLYLLDSPVVAAQELKFSVKGVKDQARKNLVRLHNVHSFFVSYANLDNFNPTGNLNTTNELDLWLLSRFNHLVKEVREDMKNYKLNQVVPRLSQFVEDLTNTYVRFNRELFWQKGMPESKQMAYETLHYVLVNFSKVLAPFTPFMAEELYQNLSATKLSVHLEEFPEVNELFFNQDKEKAVAVMMELVEMGRNYREKVKVKSKVPLKSMTVVLKSFKVLQQLKQLESLFKEELNVRQVNYREDMATYVKFEVKPNFSVLGKMLGPKLPQLTKYLKSLSVEETNLAVENQKLSWQEFNFNAEELLFNKTLLNNNDNLSLGNDCVLEFDPTVDEDQKQEGQFREVLRKVQEMRKKMNLPLDEVVTLEVKASTSFLTVLHPFLETLKNEALVKEVFFVTAVQGDSEVTMEKFPTVEESVTLGLKRF